MPCLRLPSLYAVPREVGIAQPQIVAVLQMLVVAQDLVLATEVYHLLEIAEDVGVLLLVVPVEPCYLVVLTIGVVVALLRIAHLVARQYHRYALANHEHSKGVLHLPMAQGVDFGVIALAFAATVPAVILVLAVAVFLAVGLVVLFVVRHEIHERKAVVSRDEVDTGLDAATL